MEAPARLMWYTLVPASIPFLPRDLTGCSSVIVPPSVKILISLGCSLHEDGGGGGMLDVLLSKVSSEDFVGDDDCATGFTPVIFSHISLFLALVFSV